MSHYITGRLPLQSIKPNKKGCTADVPKELRCEAGAVAKGM